MYHSWENQGETNQYGKTLFKWKLQSFEGRLSLGIAGRSGVDNRNGDATIEFHKSLLNHLASWLFLINCDWYRSVSEAAIEHYRTHSDNCSQSLQKKKSMELNWLWSPSFCVGGGRGQCYVQLSFYVGLWAIASGTFDSFSEKIWGFTKNWK